jgi:hypothetical protein
MKQKGYLYCFNIQGMRGKNGRLLNDENCNLSDLASYFVEKNDMRRNQAKIKVRDSHATIQSCS